MRKSIPNYDKLVILCGDDRASGVQVTLGKDIRDKRPLTTESESIETNDTNDVTMDSLQETRNGNDQDVMSPEVRIVEEARAKRSKKSKDETEFEAIKSASVNIGDCFKESTTKIVDAFRESTVAYEKAHQKLPISEAEIWKLLENLQIDSHLFNRVYLYLLDNPERVRAVLGCPKNRQKDLLIEMVFGSVGSSR